MSKYILAIHAGHNAGVLIGDQTGILYAIQEERLTGEKNYWGLPRNALRACLDHVGAKPTDIASIAYGSKQVLSRYHSREDVMAAYKRQSSLLGKLRQRVAMPLLTALQPNLGQGGLNDFLAAHNLADTPIRFFGHHETHAACAYYGLRANPSEEYLVFTCDGAGDGASATVSVMGNGQSRELARTHWDDSLGALYSWTTYAMGFVPLEHEYKLMGMAPYASDKSARDMADIFHGYLGLDESGLAFKRKISERINDIGEILAQDFRGKRFDWICAGLQRFTEELLAEWVSNAVAKTGIKKIVAAGGVFMNVKANQVIAQLQEVDDFEAFPSCGDETLPMGAYYQEAASRYGDGEVKPLTHFYFGDDAVVSEEETEKVLKESEFSYYRPDDISDEVARLLASGKPLARCAGPMEFGARALGNRSILADPSNQDVVRVINQMVKKRDFWMPFAPMIKKDRQHDYIENPKNLNSPYMMMTFDTKPNFKELIAAVHNADLTCRAQLIDESHNADMYKILEAFEKRTGRAVILNTSFNLHGFPIVRTAQEALYVLTNSGLEYLQVGPWIVHKGPQTKAPN
jgi:carbamoyltransferase